MSITKEKSVYIGTVSGADIISAEGSVVPANNSVANTKTGHGIMAEEAQTIIDSLTGKNAEVVGRTNIKNGADRLVDGIPVQTKFYNSGKGCIAACFDKDSGGMYKYIDDNGKPMPVEVPKDMYDDALKEFKLRISKGKVPGVTDESSAADYVRCSDLTYENAVNLCTPLTKESLIYDCVTGIVHCSFAFGISAVAAFIIEYKNSKNLKNAFISALKTGVKVFGLSYVIYILCSQFARTKLFKSLPNLTASIDKNRFAGNALADANNYIRNVSGNSISSASASLNQFSKMIKAGMLANVFALLIFIIPEVVRLIRGRLSFVGFLYNTAAIVASRILSIMLFIGMASLLTDFTKLPSIINTVLCLTASCIGGIVGRKLILDLEVKMRRGETL